MGLSDTPRGNRLHIGIYGERNAGKSSLINALTNQEIALVSPTPGTTTDPVYKSMEIHGIGPCVFIDTAGFDDEGEMGQLRIQQTEKALDKTDIALFVFTQSPTEEELKWVEKLKQKKIPIVGVFNKRDSIPHPQDLCREIKEKSGVDTWVVSALKREGMEAIREALIRALPTDFENSSMTGGMVEENDVVLLVMPQDIQAPKGRLILPQVQVTRELLDKKCILVSATTDKFKEALAALAKPPKLIITDSQVFKSIYEEKPKESMLTSFSVLLAGYKGDITYFTQSVQAIDRLSASSRVLIAEACTHAPLGEDIGRVKIPNMLRKKVGEGLKIDIVSGTDFPEDISMYDLIIHCGGCMFNRKYVLSRIQRSRTAQVPMTNYGIVIAYLAGILEQIDLPIS